MKNHLECSVARDLLPLSLEGLTGEESEHFLQMHLQECKKCRNFREELLIENEEKAASEQIEENKVLRTLKRWRYEMLGLVIGIFSVFTLIVLVIGIALFRGNNTQEDYSVKEHYEEASDYGKQDYRGISKLALFPEDIGVSGKVEDFYYDCKGGQLYQNYQIYLECSYEKHAYLAEKERLLNITDKATGCQVVYSEEENQLPCVYAMLYDEGYEYALFSDEECKIRYIYLQGIDRRELHFDVQYLPKDYGQAGDYFETERDAYRIYTK